MVWIAGFSATGSDFSITNIPQNFTHLQLRVFGRSANNPAGSDFWFQMNGDGNALYASHNLTGDGASASSTGGSGATFSVVGDSPGTTNATGIFGSTVLDILDYTNTNKFKTIRSISGWDANGSGFVGLFSGLYRSTAAITSVGLINNGWLTGTRADLYGITTSSVTGA